MVAHVEGVRDRDEVGTTAACIPGSVLPGAEELASLCAEAGGKHGYVGG